MGLASAAAFGRLCVETPELEVFIDAWVQPPSGGCVLKLELTNFDWWAWAAAFGRLCVETQNRSHKTHYPAAAAFGRLCVETRQTYERCN